MIAWRITKTRYSPFDGTGAFTWGGRWNSPGRRVLYGADCFAGAILEIVVHALRPRTLPGSHHAIRIEVPDELVEQVEPDTITGWDSASSPTAVEFGDAWFDQRRSLALLVPAVSSRPVGMNVLLNLEHPDAGVVRTSDPFLVPWDERLFG